MIQSTGVQPFTQMRRRDRAVHEQAWFRTLLHRAADGVLSTECGGQPFLNSNLFVYHEPRNAIYLHTAQVGRTRDNIVGNPSVGFSVSEMGRLLPAPTAKEFSTEYASLTIFGRATIVTSIEEAREALQRLLNKYFPHLIPGRDYRPITDAELRQTTVIRIDVDEWSGKKKQVDVDFPGAFHYRPSTAWGECTSETAWTAFSLRELIEQRRESGRAFIEFLRVPGLSMEVFELGAGALDTQLPHPDPEVYYVINGRATFRVNGETVPVMAGSVVYVHAGIEHRFRDITEDLTVLVVFGRPDMSC